MGAAVNGKMRRIGRGRSDPARRSGLFACLGVVPRHGLRNRRGEAKVSGQIVHIDTQSQGGRGQNQSGQYEGGKKGFHEVSPISRCVTILR